MSRQVGAGFRRLRGFPRVSGDEPFEFTSSARAISFSPRERG